MMPNWSRSHCTADPRNGNRTLKGVNGFGVPELVADRRQQSVLRADDLLAGVEQQEVSGAIGVLRLARGKAYLADHGGLLVADDAGQRDLSAQRSVVAGDAIGLGI